MSGKRQKQLRQLLLRGGHGHKDLRPCRASQHEWRPRKRCKQQAPKENSRCQLSSRALDVRRRKLVEETRAEKCHT